MKKTINNRVLILDGETRTALAVSRSLAELGLEVGIVAKNRRAIAANSRSCYVFFPSPNMRENPADYSGFLLKLVKSWKPRMLIPVSDLSVDICLKQYQALSELCCLPLVEPANLAVASDKHQLLELAQSLGLLVPKTLLIPNFYERTQEHIKKVKYFSYPAVLKPQRSEYEHSGIFYRLSAAYPANADEALGLISLSSARGSARVPYLLQEKVEGQGVGVFALCWQGEALVTFCHRRILEKPPSGGVSVLSESIPEQEAPVEAALALLKKLKWQGIAMVEFKQTPRGECYLMEINPRFWGSLQLAIDSGRDFPKLLYRLFTATDAERETLCQELKSLPPYKLGRRLRWVLGTLDHLFISLKEAPLKTLVQLIFFNSLRLFSAPFSTGLETFRRGDPKAFLAELKNYFIEPIFGRHGGV